VLIGVLNVLVQACARVLFYLNKEVQPSNEELPQLFLRGIILMPPHGLRYMRWAGDNARSCAFSSRATLPLRARASGLSLERFCRIQLHGVANERLQGCLIHSIVFVDVNGTHRLA